MTPREGQRGAVTPREGVPAGRSDRGGGDVAALAGPRARAGAAAAVSGAGAASEVAAPSARAGLTSRGAPKPRPPRGLGRVRAAVVRAVAPLVWRSPARIAAKLAEFAATEQGSAHDMLRAAELADDPRLRRLFFRHALDEARHARLFADVARQVHPQGAAPATDRACLHARRQDLYEALGPVAFLAFVHLAERRGEVHFRALVHALDRAHPELAALFDGVARDERFHVAYSGRWLARLSPTPRRALALAALEAAWAAYRRAGRALGDRAAALLLGALYFLVLPPFALAQRWLGRDTPSGWCELDAATHAPRVDRSPLERARRQAR